MVGTEEWPSPPAGSNKGMEKIADREGRQDGQRPSMRDLFMARPEIRDLPAVERERLFAEFIAKHGRARVDWDVMKEAARS